MLDEADIVITNPPFSMFRTYISLLMEHKKKFLIIGSQNAITYKEIFPLIKEDKIWLGYKSGDMAFRVPDYYEPRETRYWVDEKGQKWRSMGNICWFTNLDIAKRHEDILFSEQYDPSKYPHYDNYDGIEVRRVADIPEDYDGVMGVPITFLDKYNPDQFEIIGIGKTPLGNDLRTKVYGKQTQYSLKNGEEVLSKVSKLNDGTAIFSPAKPEKYPFYEVDGKFYISTYARILIRRKR